MRLDSRQQTADFRPVQIVFLLSVVCCLLSAVCWAGPQEEILKRSGVEKRLGAMAALDTPWTTSDNQNMILNSAFTGRPVILVPVYYSCPMLCQLILKGLAKGLNKLEMAGIGVYDLIVYSIDPRDTPADAATKKAEFMRDFNQNSHVNQVTFLTGSEEAIALLSKSIGFKFEKDPASGEYVHSAVLMFLSPEGKIMRYMGGIDFEPRSVKLALIEAANGKVGSFWDQILLVCYHYNPANGKYGMAVNRILQITGSFTVLCLALFIFFSLRAERGGRLKPPVV